MQSFLFALNAILPIILMVIIGYFFKQIGLIPQNLIKPLNKLIFRIFLPSMLFLNIYDIETFTFSGNGYILYTGIFTILIFLVGAPLVMLLTKKANRRGVVLQACFRSNHALIGIPLAQALCGQEGVLAASLLSASQIPIFNILAVLSLTLFQNDGKKISIKKILLDIVKNPLIISIFLGLVVLAIRAVLVRFQISFRLSDLGLVMKVLQNLSSVATPLSLLVLGAQFEFSVISSLKKEIIFGTAMRTAIVPAVSLSIAYFCFRNQFTAAHFAVLVSIFATPVAVSSVPMTQEMNGDTSLAGQLVVWTTLFSALSVFLATLILKALGIFS